MTEQPQHATAEGNHDLVAPRTDLHNVEIDETAARRHLCGNQHLQTGTQCVLPERHAGGCHFAMTD